jgi:hypothetical protein
MLTVVARARPNKLRISVWWGIVVRIQAWRQKLDWML